MATDVMNEEDLEEQQEEMENMQSMYEEWFSDISESMYTIAVPDENNHITCTLKIEYPYSYPSTDPPLFELIYNDYEFDEENVIQKMNECFEAGCPVVTEWYIIIEEEVVRLQDEKQANEAILSEQRRTNQQRREEARQQQSEQKEDERPEYLGVTFWNSFTVNSDRPLILYSVGKKKNPPPKNQQNVRLPLYK